MKNNTKTVFELVKNKIIKPLNFLRVDFSFLMIFVISLLVDEARLYLWYVVSIILHELSHFFMAKKLGYLPNKMRLTFFGASLEGYDDFLIEDEIKIVIAGPLFNLIVIIGCYLSFWFYPESFIVLSDILEANIAILIFNLLPVFPLDMGRLLLACFSIKNERGIALNFIKMLSFLSIITLFCVFILSFFYNYNFTFGFVIINICFVFFNSTKGANYKRNLHLHKKIKHLNRGLPQKIIYVKEGVSLFKLLKKIDCNHIVIFVFLDSNLKEVNSLTEFELLKKLGI